MSGSVAMMAPWNLHNLIEIQPHVDVIDHSSDAIHGRDEEFD